MPAIFAARFTEAHAEYAARKARCFGCVIVSNMFQRNGDRITISAELSEDEYTQFLFAYGMAEGAMFDRHPPLAWLLVSVMNRFEQGNPNFEQVEVPADRSRDYEYRHIRVIPLRSPPQQ